MRKNKFHYYSKNKKLLRSFTFLLSFSLLCILFSVYSQVSMFEAKRERNEKIYGAWNAAVFDISSKDEAFLRGNEMISSVGEMNVVGSVVNDPSQSPVGYVDNSFFQLSKLSLKKGRLPEKEHEIAIEAYKLDQMGIDYSLNQAIVLEIQNHDEILEKEFVLTGIVENYSTSWLHTENLIPFFVSESCGLERESKNVFVCSIEGYSDIFSDMTLPDKDLVLNNQVEFSYDAFSKQNLPYTLLAIFTMLYTILFMTYLLYNWTNQRGKELQMLKSLGCDERMLMMDFIKLIAKCICVPIFLYIFCAVVLHISWKTSLISLLVYVSSMSLIFIICKIQLDAIPENANSFSNQKNIHRKPIKVAYKKQTPISLHVRSFRFHWKRELLQLCLPIVLLVFLYQSLSFQMNNRTQLEILRKQSDIFLSAQIQSKQKDDFVYSTFEPIEPKVVSEILSNQSIASYRTNYVTQDYYMTWDGFEDSDIWKRKESQLDPILNMDWNGMKQVFPQIECSKDEAYIQFLQDNITEGTFDLDAFQKGEVVYIYLPKYTVEILEEESDLFGNISADENTFYDDYMTFLETTIHVGDKLVFHNESGEGKTGRVGGIIRNYIEPQEYIFNLPYQVFVSSSFFGKEDLVRNIYLYLKEDIQTEPIESYLSSIASKHHLQFIDKINKKNTQIDSNKNDLAFYVVLSIAISLLFLFTQSLFLKQKQEEKENQNRIFEQLGIDTKGLYRAQIIEEILKIFILLVVSFMIFLLIQYIFYLQNASQMYSFKTRVFKDSWSWIYYFVINVLFIITYLRLNITKNKH
ncbi:MAG: hypothetical protein Q4C49_06870 [Bacillota bacterium]|nr:hypothetical protein [Bacillota bacterium]